MKLAFAARRSHAAVNSVFASTAIHHRSVVEQMESRLLFSGLDGSEVVGLPSDMKTSLYTFIGDHSSSNSEAWTMNVGGHSFSASYGEIRRDQTEYKKGETYPITVVHDGTNLEEPDYDYRAWVDKSANPAWTSGPTTVSGPTYFATDENSPALLQKQWFDDNDDHQDATVGKTAYLHIPSVDLTGDSNEDGTIDLEDSKIENDNKKGPWIPASTNDIDNVGEIDFADLKIDGGSFVPLTLDLSANIAQAQPTSISFTFDYGQANIPIDQDEASGLTNPDLGGLLYLWKKDASTQRVAGDLLTNGTSFNLSLEPGESTSIYVQAVGAARGTNALPIKVTATITGTVWSGTLTDTVYVSPVAVDADIDTHNDNGFSVPQQDKLEDRDEDRLTDADSNPLPGKPVVVNTGDMDEDGIPDFADGYNRDGTANDDDTSANVKFVPFTIRIPENVDPSKATFRFDYSASDPSSVDRIGDGTVESPYIYTPAEGHFRIWTKNGSDARNKAIANTSGGHYVAPGEGNVYTAANLGAASGSRTITLWLEAVQQTADLGEGRISVTMDPDGTGPADFITADAFRTTPITARFAVDANGDGVINTDSRDFTTYDKPFRFWLNDNSDGYDDSFGGGVAGLVGNYPKDLEDTYIGSDVGTNGDADRKSGVFRRDLEDFAAVNLAYSKTTALLSDKVEIQIKNASSNNMKLRLWRADSLQGVEFEDNTKLRTVQSTRHVTAPGFTDSIEAVTNNYNHSNPNSFRGVYADEPVELTIADFENDFGLNHQSDGVTFAMLLFEGVVAGSGKVTITFKNGNTVIATSAFDLDLHKSDDLYEHYTVATGPGVAADGTWSNSGTAIDPRTTPVPTTPTLIAGNQAATYARDKDYVLFVHGWNMTAPERVSFADTAYKRLYWQGYRGTFGLFSWPTQKSPGIPTNSTEAGNFNHSEEIAWNSAAGLRSLLNSKQSVRTSGGKLALIGHSMGGIVVSEALAQSGNTNIVDTTVLTQAAVTTEFYSGVANPTPYYSAFGGEVGGANPRFRHIDQATMKLVNFNNEVDFAMELWYENNNAKPGGPDHGSWSITGLLPPAGFLDAQYEVAAGSPATVTRNVPSAAPVVLTFPADRYEMFAHGLYTEANPIGRVNAWPGPFTGAFDLQTIGFGASRSDHSGQFNHTNISMKGYWARFMQEAGL